MVALHALLLTFACQADPSDVGVPPANLPRAIVLPLTTLGVDAERATAVQRALMKTLRERYIVVDGAALTDSERARLENCARLSCVDPLARANADVVVFGTLMPMGGALSVVLHKKSVDDDVTAQSSDTSAENSEDALARAAVVAMHASPAAKSPAAKSPAAKAPSEKSPAAKAPGDDEIDHLKSFPGHDYPPALMLLLSYGLNFVPLIGSPLVLPIVQAYVMSAYGPEMVGVAYDDIMTAAIAGYATYAVGFGGGIALYIVGLYITLNSFNDGTIGIPLAIAGGVVFVGSLLVEPAIVYAVATANAHVAGPLDAPIKE